MRMFFSPSPTVATKSVAVGHFLLCSCTNNSISFSAVRVRLPCNFHAVAANEEEEKNREIWQSKCTYAAEGGKRLPLLHVAF